MKDVLKLVIFIVQFHFFCMITHIFTVNIFSKKTFLLSKFENIILSCTFPTKAIPSVFDEVKLAAYGSENV